MIMPDEIANTPITERFGKLRRWHVIYKYLWANEDNTVEGGWVWRSVARIKQGRLVLEP
jgi:hypothetical protein